MTLIAIEAKKKDVQKDNECPYCCGGGELTCAQCLGTGALVMSNENTGKIVSMACPSCGGRAQVTCINCKGDGRSTPVFLNRRASRDPETELEDVGMA
jgi:DnaJ-class molecular chaperone